MTGPYLARCADGAVQGHARSGVIRFDGIPFAAPPIDRLRFRPPSPPAPRASPLQAIQPGPGPLQRPGPALGTRPINAVSEDCLRLNVVTSDLSGLRPVMVWIHGVALLAGSGTFQQHGPQHLLEREVVLVTVNYRLGALGFLSLGNEQVSSSEGR